MRQRDRAIPSWPALQDPQYISDRHAGDADVRLFRYTGDVRGKDQVWTALEDSTSVRLHWLHVEHVERGAAQRSCLQCSRKRGLIDHTATRRVDQDRTRLHA